MNDTHRKVRPALYHSWKKEGRRVVKIGELATILPLTPEEVLRRFGVLSRKATFFSSATPHVCWTLQVEFPWDATKKANVHGTLSMDHPLHLGPLPETSAFFEFFVPAGWSEQVCQVWEVGIRSFRLVPTNEKHGTPLRAWMWDGQWDLVGVLDNGEQYQGRNPQHPTPKRRP